MNDDELPPPLLMLKRQEELVRHRLSILPEIKEEMRHYIEMGKVNEAMSNLPKLLSHLEEIPDIQEALKEPDINKLFPIYGKLERIKSAALSEILTIRTNHAAGLNGWRTGGHRTKDGLGHITKDIFVKRLWAVDILPSFDVSARIVVVYQPTYLEITFGVGMSPDNVSSSVIRAELPQTWIDPVGSILCNLDLFHDDSRLTLDGIGYEFYYSTLGSKTHIHFANPDNSQFIELEKAFFSVAETITNQVGQQIENDYLAIWKKYLSRPENT